MNESESNPADLFGNALPAEDVFENGTYTIRGAKMAHGIYKSGKFQDKPYARFSYEIERGTHRGTSVSQMLPWLPKWAPFESNFEVLTGMNRTTFKEACTSLGHQTPQAELGYFVSLFEGTIYLADLHQSNGYINVWNLKQRGDLSTAEEPGGAIDARELLDAEIEKLAQSLGLDREKMDALAGEEFAVESYDKLSTADKTQMLALLEERRRTPDAGDDSLPF